MPSWDFQCDTCGHRVNDVIAKISEYDAASLKGQPCQNNCPGHYDHTFTRPANFSFKGGAPTPKFFR